MSETTKMFSEHSCEKWNTGLVKKKKKGQNKKRTESEVSLKTTTSCRYLRAASEEQRSDAVAAPGQRLHAVACDLVAPRQVQQLEHPAAVTAAKKQQRQTVKRRAFTITA